MLTAILPRLIEERLLESLQDSPAVLVHGARQAGKTTVARRLGEPRGYQYFSFDDATLTNAAKADPTGFVLDLPTHSILDEVQRVPEIFPALKEVIDRDRRPGRFLLTGSSNVLLLPKLSDSLAGRLAIHQLLPLSQLELSGQRPVLLDQLRDGKFALARQDRLGSKLADVLVAGGYPAALARSSPSRRAAWYRDYVETIVQRDVRDITRISRLDALPRLLTIAAAQSARLLNVSDLAGPFQLSRPTIRDYVTLLQRVYLLDELMPWHSNRLSRLIKTPKLHIGDTGVAAALLGLTARGLYEDREVFGQLLETFVYQELRKQAEADEVEGRFFHYRDKDGYEVDIVIETDGRVAGVEVKAGATVKSSDLRGLRRLRDAAGRRFSSGIVLYDGETSVRLEDRLYAVPLTRLWEGTSASSSASRSR
jgi:uncharacterized protein